MLFFLYLEPMRFVRILISSSLAVVVLLYAGGVQVYKHYCFDELKSKSLNWTVQDCGGAEKSNSPLEGLQKSSCCKSESFFSQVQEFQKVQQHQTLLSITRDLNVEYLQPVRQSEKQYSFYKRPPPDERRLYLMIAQFLI